MEKSRVMVSLPITDFEYLEKYENLYKELVQNIVECCDTTLFPTSGRVSIKINQVKDLVRKCLPKKFECAHFDICNCW